MKVELAKQEPIKYNPKIIIRIRFRRIVSNKIYTAKAARSNAFRSSFYTLINEKQNEICRIVEVLNEQNN